MPNKILCRFGELSTKQGNRNEFIKLLKKNIQVALREFDSIEIKRTFDRLIISYDDIDEQAIIDILKTVFGLSSFSIIRAMDLDMDAIISFIIEQMMQKAPSKFKVYSRRLNKSFQYTSDDINRMVATSILKNTEHVVDVHQPEIKIRIECKHHQAFVSLETYRGPMGMPVRMAGKGLLLLSGGFDSPVAGYLANKRGIEYAAIHFETVPFTSLKATDKVLKLAQKLSLYQNSTQVLVVPFAKVQMVINETVPESYRITIMRRMMVRIANQLADTVYASVLITGESVGQVASQTLSSMIRIDEVSEKMIVRPLVTYDKDEIIDIARKVDTYDLSILPFDDCCTVFTPAHPITNPLKEKTERFESFGEYEAVIADAIKHTKYYKINKSKIIEEQE